MSKTDHVPFTMIPLEDGRTKVVFSVPEGLVSSLTAHPILCRGSSFTLSFVSAAVHRKLPIPARKTEYLSVDFYSPQPKETAEELSRRLAIRMENVDNFLLASIMGSFWSSSEET